MVKEKIPGYADAANPSREDVFAVVCNYIGSTGDHNSREWTEPIIQHLDTMRELIDTWHDHVKLSAEIG